MNPKRRQKIIYPYQDTERWLLPTERWLEIPGYEGYYEVSNLGRVRSVDRVVPHPRWGRQFVAGRILKQKKCFNTNSFTGDEMQYLQVALNLEARARYSNVRRLVWLAFRGSPGDHLILNKDGDGCNNRLKNLTIATYPEKQQRVIRRGRVDYGYLTTIDRSGWKKNQSRAKPLLQLSEKGRVVRRFESLRHMNETLGYCAKGVSNAAKGIHKSWRGYLWKFC